MQPLNPESMTFCLQDFNLEDVIHNLEEQLHCMSGATVHFEIKNVLHCICLTKFILNFYSYWDKVKANNINV